jgi:hypothetical protein
MEIGTASKVVLGVAVAAGMASGFVSGRNLLETGRSHRSDDPKPRGYGIPRADRNRNLGALAGAAGLGAGGVGLLAISAPKGGVEALGIGALALGGGFIAGQLLSIFP